MFIKININDLELKQENDLISFLVKNNIVFRESEDW